MKCFVCERPIGARDARTEVELATFAGRREVARFRRPLCAGLSIAAEQQVRGGDVDLQAG